MSVKTSMILIAGLMTLTLAIVYRPHHTVPLPPPEQTETLSARRMLKPRLPAPRMLAKTPVTEMQADNARPTNLLARLLNGDEAFKLNLQQVESYLQDNRRSAESLLAAFRATDNPALLREAVEKYPNDPRVNFAAYFAFRNESSPEDCRQRLEAFKKSSPDNALANLYRQAGDEASAQAALQMGVTLGRQVGEPSGQNYLISDLVGLAIERQILERMDSASPYDNAGQTVKDRLEELARRRETYKQLQGPVDSSGRWSSATDVMASLSEQDRISFFDRIKVIGELEALRWARNRLSQE